MIFVQVRIGTQTCTNLISNELIFVQTKKNAEFLATHLCGDDVTVTTSIHGDR